MERGSTSTLELKKVNVDGSGFSGVGWVPENSDDATEKGGKEMEMPVPASRREQRPLTLYQIYDDLSSLRYNGGAVR